MGLKLLCVIAHPDDECFAFGGALALAADRGVETSVVCLTSGDAGSYRGNTRSPQELAGVRRAEFADSCKILGVAHHEVLDYKDGQLEHANFSTMAGRIVERIRSFRPQVVITFGADGALNTHPDHTVVSAATTAAFHWAGHPRRYLELGPLFQPQRLFHVTTNFFLPDRHRSVPAPWTLTLDIRGSAFDRKQAAFAAHTTQAPLLRQTEAVFAAHGQDELYTLMASQVPQPATQSSDMFEAVAIT